MLCEKGLLKPSSEEWLKEAKKSVHADKIGMYLIHNGVVRSTPKKEIYEPGTENRIVSRMRFSVDINKASKVCEDGSKLPGVYYVRAWLADGMLNVGDDIMQVLIGADCRTNCINALNTIVSALKNECVIEEEILE